MRHLTLALALVPLLSSCVAGAGRYIIEPPNFVDASVDAGVDDDGDVHAQVDATFTWFGIEGMLIVAVDTGEAWVRICYQADPDSQEEDPLCYEVPVPAWSDDVLPEVVDVELAEPPSEGSEE